MHQIPKFKCFSSRLADVFVQYIVARCWVKNEDVVGAALTSDAPTTCGWSTILLPKVQLILGVWWWVNTVCAITMLPQWSRASGKWSVLVQTLPSSLLYKTHFSGQLNYCTLKCSWSITCRRCSNYIFILNWTPGFNGLGKDNYKMRHEAFKFWDLVHLILETLWYFTNLSTGPFRQATYYFC